MSDLCVITARGGSKRIPYKNVREFVGKPIIAYPIQAALESGLFDEVMVSTDDETIADVSRSYGASIPFMRSAQTSDDFATTADVLREVLEEYAKSGYKFDRLCCIYPTAPFATADKLKLAKSELESDDRCPSVIAVAAFSFPPQRGFLNEAGHVRWWQPEFERVRSQDLPTIFHDAGQFYYARVDDFLLSGSLVMNGTKAIEVPETEVQDIDNLTDWELAEIKYERMIARNE